MGLAKSGRNHLQVASGNSLDQPIIIVNGYGKRPSCRVWNGVHGFSGTPEIRRHFWDLPDGSGLKSVSRRYRPDPESTTSVPPVTATATVATEPAPSIEPSEASQPPGVPPNPRVIDFAAEDNLILSAPHTSTIAGSEENSRHQFPEPRSPLIISPALTRFMSAHTTVHFISSDKTTSRIRPFSFCDSVGKLFMQAHTAKLFQTADEFVSLSITVNGMEKGGLVVPRDDTHDFDAVVQAISDDPCSERKGEQAECVLRVPRFYS